jgi:hypothetical protein
MATATRIRPTRQTASNGHASNGSNGHRGNGNGQPKPLVNRLNGNGTTNGNGSLAGKPAASHRLCDAEAEILARQLEAEQAAAKAHYAEADRLQDQLIAALGIGTAIVLSDGRTLRIKDNFVDAAGNPRNVSYRPCGVKRFEVVVK